MNYFELLGLSPAFNLDLQALESAYFTQQRLYHPDRFVGKLPAERQAALHRSVDINKAYETLKNPFSRAQYLLHLQGTQVGTDHDTVKPSQALLMEIMELREEGVQKEVLERMIVESQAHIAAHFLASRFAEMAQETLRLGYLIKART